MSTYCATDEEKAERKRKRDMMRGLCQRLSAMSETDRAAFTAKLPTVVSVDGRALSMYNTAMLYWQGFRGDGIVGGFRQWKSVARTVRKGQHGFAIWVPIRHKGEENLASEETETTGFILGTVFDLSQTCEIGQEVEV